MEIKIKNGLSTNLDKAGVVKGELKFTTDTNRIYVGNGSANVEIPNATDLASKSTVTASATGTSTNSVRFLTIDGTEYKIQTPDNWAYDESTKTLTNLSGTTSYDESTKTIEIND